MDENEAPESTNSEQQRVDFLAGEVQALVAVLYAVIDCVPDLEKLRARLSAYGTESATNALYSKAADGHQDGHRHVLEAVTAAVALEAERRGRQPRQVSPEAGTSP